MNIYEENKYPWLKLEKRFIEKAIMKNRLLIGICLGAQLIADVLGARVTRNRFREIGWFPVQLTPEAAESVLFNFLPKKFFAFHWHGDTFEIPKGARRLASSEACENQAFIYRDRIIGFQFHLEATLASVRALIENCQNEIEEGPCIQQPGEMMADKTLFKHINQKIAGILDRIEKTIKVKE